MLTDSIFSFQTGTYAVARRGVGTLTNGVYTDASPTTLTIAASIQPVTGRDLKMMPEGRYGEEMRVVFTRTPLRTAGIDGQADMITYNSESWEVIKVEIWPDLVGPGAAGGEFCKAFISRQAVR